jgi:hypothetical protein
MDPLGAPRVRCAMARRLRSPPLLGPTPDISSAAAAADNDRLGPRPDPAGVFERTSPRFSEMRHGWCPYNIYSERARLALEFARRRVYDAVLIDNTGPGRSRPP